MGSAMPLELLAKAADDVQRHIHDGYLGATGRSATGFTTRPGGGARLLREPK